MASFNMNFEQILAEYRKTEDFQKYCDDLTNYYNNAFLLPLSDSETLGILTVWATFINTIMKVGNKDVCKQWEQSGAFTKVFPYVEVKFPNTFHPITK